MAVRARFYVSKVTKQVVTGGSPFYTVDLTPVTRSTEDNIAWSKYTPTGSITLGITVDGGQTWFEDRLGKDVAITFDDVASE